MAQIAITPEEVASVSGQLSSAALNIQQTGADALLQASSLTATFTGQSGAAFQACYQEWNAGLAQIQEALTGIVALLSQAATTFTDTDSGVAGTFSGAGGRS
jgi:WXG100 family type VII secretion target